MALKDKPFRNREKIRSQVGDKWCVIAQECLIQDSNRILRGSLFPHCISGPALS